MGKHRYSSCFKLEIEVCKSLSWLDGWVVSMYCTWSRCCRSLGRTPKPVSGGCDWPGTWSCTGNTAGHPPRTWWWGPTSSRPGQNYQVQYLSSLTADFCTRHNQIWTMRYEILYEIWESLWRQSFKCRSDLWVQYRRHNRSLILRGGNSLQQYTHTTALTDPVLIISFLMKVGFEGGEVVYCRRSPDKW